MRENEIFYRVKPVILCINEINIINEMKIFTFFNLKKFLFTTKDGTRFRVGFLYLSVIKK